MTKKTVNRALLLYKFSSEPYVPEAYWNTNRGFVLDETLKLADFVESNIKTEVHQYIPWEIPPHKW
jgi:hypothetical protein